MVRRNTTEVRISVPSAILKSDPQSNDPRKQFDVLVVRMCVLFEDLRLELNAIEADSIPKLDVLDPAGRFVETKDVGKARRHYFLRRSIGTLHEFAEAIRWINACPEMHALKNSWGSVEATKTWDSAVSFFLTNQRFIEDVRNDIGGHFGINAAHTL